MRGATIFLAVTLLTASVGQAADRVKIEGQIIEVFKDRAIKVQDKETKKQYLVRIGKKVLINQFSLEDQKQLRVTRIDFKDLSNRKGVDGWDCRIEVDQLNQQGCDAIYVVVVENVPVRRPEK